MIYSILYYMTGYFVVLPGIATGVTKLTCFLCWSLPKKVINYYTTPTDNNIEIGNEIPIFGTKCQRCQYTIKDEQKVQTQPRIRLTLEEYVNLYGDDFLNVEADNISKESLLKESLKITN